MTPVAAEKSSNENGESIGSPSSVDTLVITPPRVVTAAAAASVDSVLAIDSQVPPATPTAEVQPPQPPPPRLQPRMSDPFSGFKIDSWQVGIFMLFLFTGHAPMDTDAPGKLHRLLKWIDDRREGDLGEYPMRYEHIPSPGAKSQTDMRKVKDIVPSSALKLLEQLLQCDPAKRPTMSEMRWFPWLRYEHPEVVRLQQWWRGRLWRRRRRKDPDERM